jgi:hypothetical protein
MVYNQLFFKKPDETIVNKLINAFGLSSIKDTTEFNVITMTNINTMDKIKELKNELENYYLPCKSRKFITDFTAKECINIFRQFLKMVDYTLISKEKYINGIKYSVYHIISIDEKKQMETQKPGQFFITFD